MAYKQKSPIVVKEGGTGIQTATAYAPLVGGTTPTGALQSAGTGIANVGYVLTSTGSSSVPTWQVGGGGGGASTGSIAYVSNGAGQRTYNLSGTDPPAGSTFYWPIFYSAITAATSVRSVEANSQVSSPFDGVLDNLYMVITNNSVANLLDQVMTVRINGVDTAVTVTIPSGGATGIFATTTESAVVSQGDFVTFSATAPTDGQIGAFGYAALRWRGT